jgi:DnaJ-domain-containing protein 1
VAANNDIAGLGAKTDRPRLNPTINFSALKLTTTEAFILSRVDGRSSYDEVCRMSSLGREETLAILRKLKKDEVILGPGQSPTATKAPPRRSPRPSPSPDHRPRTPAPVVVTHEMLRKAQEMAGGQAEESKAAITSVLDRLDDGSAVDPADLIEGHDLSADFKRRLIRLQRRLRKLEPHELLGVDKDADGAAVKRAFAAASKELHPDRYFGKDLGPFRERLAQIFARITEAVQEIEKARKAKK